jgi:hypothetical protein
MRSPLGLGFAYSNPANTALEALVTFRTPGSLKNKKYPFYIGE